MQTCVRVEAAISSRGLLGGGGGLLCGSLPARRIACRFRGYVEVGEANFCAAFKLAIVTSSGC